VSAGSGAREKHKLPKNILRTENKQCTLLPVLIVVGF
jgi:hypothetical protein